ITPMIQPKSADDTNQPSKKLSKLNCIFTKGNTPDTTAISNPKIKPPNEAIMATKANCLLEIFTCRSLVYNCYFDTPQFLFGSAPISKINSPPFNNSSALK